VPKQGRPTSYNPKYCKEIIEFFEQDRSRDVEKTHTNRKGDTWTSYEEVANPLPFYQDFAKQIGVTHQTLINWTKKHPEFFEAYKAAKQLQESFLINNALLGLFNSSFSIFTAKNILGWRDVKDITVHPSEFAREFMDRFKDKYPELHNALGDVLAEMEGEEDVCKPVT
jgi:hypothetical protein